MTSPLSNETAEKKDPGTITARLSKQDEKFLDVFPTDFSTGGDPLDEPLDALTTEYKFIHFEKYDETPKTSKWRAVNNKSGAVLGLVHFYPAWQEYCFFTVPDCVFNSGCLTDIIDFLGQLNEQ